MVQTKYVLRSERHLQKSFVLSLWDKVETVGRWVLHSRFPGRLPKLPGGSCSPGREQGTCEIVWRRPEATEENRQHQWPALADLDLQPPWESRSSLHNIKKNQKEGTSVIPHVWRNSYSLPHCGRYFPLLFWTTKYHVEEETSIIANFRSLQRSLPKILYKEGEKIIMWWSFLGVWAQSASTGCGWKWAFNFKRHLTKQSGNWLLCGDVDTFAF